MDRGKGSIGMIWTRGVMSRGRALQRVRGAGDWRWYGRVARIRDLAAHDVGRGSETLMTFSRADLFRAARTLATGGASRALVVTGFYIPAAQEPAAESDGPAGAVEICAALRALGGDGWMVSDHWCEPVVSAAAKGILPQDRVLIAPREEGDFDPWMESLRNLVRKRGIDTVIYIERVGPSRDGSPKNMRGVDIRQWTAPLSRLTELGLHTIGIGDGGNEIGMGRIDSLPIETVVDHGVQIVCTIPTQELIVAGTSNWGGHALVCAMRAMGHTELDPFLDVSWHRGVLDNIMRSGGLDGVTLMNTPTVDGLTEEDYYHAIRVLSNAAR